MERKVPHVVSNRANIDSKIDASCCSGCRWKGEGELVITKMQRHYIVNKHYKVDR
jgi:hypothetical protein